MATKRIDCDILLVAIHVQGHSISYACTTRMWTYTSYAHLVFFRGPAVVPRVLSVLCCVVLCCAVLCCAVLCCAVLCRAMSCRALLCRVVLCRAVFRCDWLCCAVWCPLTSSLAILAPVVPIVQAFGTVCVSTMILDTLCFAGH